jgi:hypothetical protein
MFKFLKVFVVMMLMVACSLSAQAGYWTVTYTDPWGGWSADYWQNGQHIQPNGTNGAYAGGWGKVFSTPSDANTLSSGSSFQKITPVLVWVKSSPWDVPPTYVTVLQEVQIQCYSGHWYNLALGFSPVEITDNSTSTNCDVYAWKDFVIDNPSRSSVITLSDVTSGVAIDWCYNGTYVNLWFRVSVTS